MDTRDYERFVQNLHDFNDTKAATHDRIKNGDLRSPRLTEATREQLVTIHGWCLMKNHYHLLLSEIEDGGITKFIRKLNIGYAKYFNERYERSGTLFQGRTKKKLIDTDQYFLHILHYIHLNPLDYLQGARNWRERKIGSASQAIAQLEKYPWSSYNDYCNKARFPAIVDTGLFQDSLGDVGKSTSQYMKHIEIDNLKTYLLE